MSKDEIQRLMPIALIMMLKGNVKQKAEGLAFFAALPERVQS